MCVWVEFCVCVCVLCIWRWRYTKTVFPAPWTPFIPRKNGGVFVLSLLCFSVWILNRSRTNGIQYWLLSSIISGIFDLGSDLNDFEIFGLVSIVWIGLDLVFRFLSCLVGQSVWVCINIIE